MEIQYGAKTRPQMSSELLIVASKRSKKLQGLNGTQPKIGKYQQITEFKVSNSMLEINT